MIINIINLPKRIDRREMVVAQMEMQGCEYKIWQGVVGHKPKTNIQKAFKNIVRSYKNQNADYVCIAEDDLIWTAPGAWKYFLQNMPKDFDVYAGSYYSGTHDENFVVSGFRGNTLIIIAKRFFDKFLWLPEDHHLDAAMSIAGAKIVVSPKFVCLQLPGFSDQRKRYADDSSRINGKILFSGIEEEK